MPPHTVITTMLRGLLGTLAQIIVVYGVVLLVAGYGLDSAALGGSPCALGLLLHLLSGSVVVPLVQCPRTIDTDLDTLICKIMGKDIF